MQIKATAQELYEAINHKYALSLAMTEPAVLLTEQLVKEVVRAINHNINEIDGYRRVPVMIRGAEHLPPAPNQVNQLMMQLVHEHCQDDGLDPFLREARFHLRFERIHPFEDGNGRTGRILINRGLVASGQAPVVIPMENRIKYMELLAEGGGEGLAAMLHRLSSKERGHMNVFAQM